MQVSQLQAELQAAQQALVASQDEMQSRINSQANQYCDKLDAAESQVVMGVGW